MADPLSISASVVGIAVPALHGARLLLNDLEKIINAPEAVRRVREDVDSISTSLGLLKDVEESVWLALGSTIQNQSSSTVQACETMCDTIRGDIQRWTKRSKGGSLSWLDRFNVGFREHQLKAHSARLQSSRLTLHSIVGTATLYSSIRNSKLTGELRDAITSQQNRIAAASSSMRTETAVVQRNLAEAQSRQSADVAASADDDDFDTMIIYLESHMAALRLSQELLTELASKCQPAEAAKVARGRETINNTFGSNYSGMQIGMSYGPVTWNRDK